MTRLSRQTPEGKPLSDYLVAASVSGGKDSAALSLWLREEGIPHRRVMADTGWEHDWTMEYVRGELSAQIGPIEVLQTEGMGALVRRKGLFPSRLARFCTEFLKLRPLGKWVAQRQDEGDEVVFAVGLRAEESEARAKMPEWEWSKDMDCWVWRPLLHWTEADVIAIHQRNGLRPNPLYLHREGVRRVGCWPCIFSRKSEVAKIARMSPERIDLIRKLEAEVADIQDAKAKAKGEQRLKAHSTFFYKGSQVSIDEAVEWANGKQMALFDGEDQPEGCVRWGMCEAQND